MEVRRPQHIGTARDRPNRDVLRTVFPLLHGGVALADIRLYMRRVSPVRSPHKVGVRRGTLADLDALCDLENKVFETDRMSRRSLRRLLVSPGAIVLVAVADPRVAGVAVLLFRANSTVARLYSLAVAPKHTGRGIASTLLAAAETAARKRGSTRLRLEVHERNNSAIGCYRKAGFCEFGRYCQYYEDKGHALRFEKMLARK